jgi:hypothetical protein
MQRIPNGESGNDTRIAWAWLRVMSLSGKVGRFGITAQ